MHSLYVYSHSLFVSFYLSVSPSLPLSIYLCRSFCVYNDPDFNPLPSVKKLFSMLYTFHSFSAYLFVCLSPSFGLFVSLLVDLFGCVMTFSLIQYARWRNWFQCYIHLIHSLPICLSPSRLSLFPLQS